MDELREIAAGPTGHRPRIGGWAGPAAVVMLYFGLLAAIVVDEVVCRSFWISRHLPEGVQAALHVVYAPVIWWFGQ